jgi:hypothetical protein
MIQLIRISGTEDPPRVRAEAGLLGVHAATGHGQRRG